MAIQFSPDFSVTSKLPPWHWPWGELPQFVLDELLEGVLPERTDISQVDRGSFLNDLCWSSLPRDEKVLIVDGWKKRTLSAEDIAKIVAVLHERDTNPDNSAIRPLLEIGREWASILITDNTAAFVTFLRHVLGALAYGTPFPVKIQDESRMACRQALEIGFEAQHWSRSTKQGLTDYLDAVRWDFDPPAVQRVGRSTQQEDNDLDFELSIPEAVLPKSTLSSDIIYRINGDKADHFHQALVFPIARIRGTRLAPFYGYPVLVLIEFLSGVVFGYKVKAEKPSLASAQDADWPISSSGEFDLSEFAKHIGTVARENNPFTRQKQLPKGVSEVELDLIASGDRPFLYAAMDKMKGFVEHLAEFSILFRGYPSMLLEQLDERVRLRLDDFRASLIDHDAARVIAKLPSVTTDSYNYLRNGNIASRRQAIEALPFLAGYFTDPLLDFDPFRESFSDKIDANPTCDKAFVYKVAGEYFDFPIDWPKDIDTEAKRREIAFRLLGERPELATWIAENGGNWERSVRNLFVLSKEHWPRTREEWGIFNSWRHPPWVKQLSEWPRQSSEEIGQKKTGGAWCHSANNLRFPEIGEDGAARRDENGRYIILFAIESESDVEDFVGDIVDCAMRIIQKATESNEEMAKALHSPAQDDKAIMVLGKILHNAEKFLWSRLESIGLPNYRVMATHENTAPVKKKSISIFKLARAAFAFFQYRAKRERSDDSSRFEWGVPVDMLIDCGDGFRASFLRDSFELAEEGRVLRHCAGQYTKHSYLDGSFVVSLRHGERPVATAEFVAEIDHGVVTGKLSLIQAKGFANQEPKPDERAALKRLQDALNRDLETYNNVRRLKKLADERAADDEIRERFYAFEWDEAGIAAMKHSLKGLVDLEKLVHAVAMDVVISMQKS